MQYFVCFFLVEYLAEEEGSGGDGSGLVIEDVPTDDEDMLNKGGYEGSGHDSDDEHDNHRNNVYSYNPDPPPKIAKNPDITFTDHDNSVGAKPTPTSSTDKRTALCQVLYVYVLPSVMVWIGRIF